MARDPLDYLGVGSATEADAGKVKLASSAESVTGTNTNKAVTPAGLKAAIVDNREETHVTVQQNPIMQAIAATGAAPTGVNGAVNVMGMQEGIQLEQFIIGTQTIIAPRMTANGLAIELDNTNAEGAEYNFGARSNAKHVYTIGTDAAFYAEATIYVTDLSGCAPLMMGFRKVEANNATLASYTDYAAIGINNATSALNVTTITEVNAGGQVLTDTTDAWGGDAAAQKIKILVDGDGAVTYQINGAAPTVAAAFSFDPADEVMFFLYFVNGSDVAGTIGLQELDIAYQV